MALTGLVFTANTSYAIDFNFSFSDDPSDNIFGKSHVSGTVTGTIKGLVDNLENQVPTEVEITSFPSGLGFTSSDPFTLTPSFTGAGSTGTVDVSGGEIVAIDLFKNFSANGCSVCQFRLNNSSSFNHLFNNDLAPDVVTGNTDGFSGVTYSQASVPFKFSPSLGIISIIGLVGIKKSSKYLKQM